MKIINFQYSRNLLLMLIIFILTLSGCVSESGLKGRKALRDFTILNPESVGCGPDFFILKTNDTCTNICEDGQHIGSTAEIAAEIETLPNPPGNLGEIIAASAGVCVDDIIEVIRPSEVFVERDYCACQANRAIIINDCQNFCRDQDENVPFLYGTVRVGPSIELNDSLQNFAGWCLNNIDDGRTGASCTLDVFDGASTISLPFTPAANSNSFKIDISLLQTDRTYVATFIESGSGSNARSDSFQIRRVTPPTDDIINNTPLKLMPVSQYTCLARTGPVPADNTFFFVNAARLHFYFPSNGAPDPLPPGNDFLTCHDPQFGKNDSPLFPRLELIPQHYSVWDQGDTRFADLNQNGRPDINETIEQNLLALGVARSIDVFGLLSWPNGPTQSSTANAPNIGFFMVPFIDQLTLRGFCPTQVDYNGNDKLFNVLKEIIIVDTEGIFIAKKEPVALTDSDGNTIAAPDDFIFIRENLLTKLWFFIENGEIKVPRDNSDDANRHTIFFYWPPDPLNPLIQKSTQKVYTIRDPASIGGNVQSGLQTQINPPDKRFGCIPAQD